MRILVFNPAFIGDAVLTTPLANALTKLPGKPEVFLCVRPEAAPLFKNLPFKTIVFDKRCADGGVRGTIKFISKLKEMNFTAVYSPHRSVRSAIVLALAGIPLRVGFSSSAGSFLYTCLVKRDKALHEIRRNLALLPDDARHFATEDTLTYTDFEYKRELEKGLKDGAPIIGIAAGSVWETKRWETVYFAQLAKLLSDKGYRIALFGGPGDRAVNSLLTEHLKRDGVTYYDFANTIPFEKYPAALDMAALLISNDSAPVHIAESRNIPVIAIFGPTAPAFGFAPIKPKSAVCEVKGLPCRPCAIHGGRCCPKGHFRCMKELLPEAVLKTALELLK
ncbi:MAG: glycosyltransferase family 9 protein [Deferribacteraceae bacterium]|jgi:heptosyltransferase-2|nr:glycosyltransferase family 9 protein [Deferribacteraceae bacterium]